MVEEQWQGSNAGGVVVGGQWWRSIVGGAVVRAGASVRWAKG